jgi:nucleoid DNA-binding protein
MTKSEITNSLVEDTGLARKDVQAVLDGLGDLIFRHIKKRSVGAFSLPGLFKITTVKKPARKARKGINPFTGEEAVFAAKPAQTVVKIRPLKGMKDMVE